MRKLWFSLLLLCGSALASGSYILAQSDVGSPAPFAPLRQAGPHFAVTSFVYDTLLWRDATRAIPWLAQSWSWNEARTALTVRLRPRVTWHDGQAFDSGDVKYTFELLRSKPELSNQGELVSTYLDRVETPNPTTAVFVLKRPVLDFLERVLGWEKIVPEHIWSKVTDQLNYQGADRFVGTGPFKVKEYRPGEYYLFEANNAYFAGKPRVDQLILRQVSNPVLALRQGEVDAAPLSPTQAKEFEGRAGFALTGPNPSYFYSTVLFNTNRAPTNSREFRQAIAYGINRARIIEQGLQGDGIPASTGTIHPESPWFGNQMPEYAYNPETALAMLQKLGFRRQGEALLDAQGRQAELPIVCRGQENVRICQLVQQDINRLGFKTEIRVLETGPNQQVLDRGDFVINVNGHGGTFNFFPNPDFPGRYYKNPRYDELYKRWNETTSAAERLRAALELQRLLAVDLPKLTLHHPIDRGVFREKEGIRLFWTKGGLAGRGGPPSYYNKLAFIEGGLASR
ncbi:ABC transporter substrate-binding protein [Meiothermus sp.]|uniref:ABC transporter substrate-binding protein n=1 Tax=Meiothermus sp. TaxID=1955249 RepID=UPI00307EE416